jgi:hypothetical protein
MDQSSSVWKEIKSTEDIKNLWDSFGYFHDACLKELHLWTDYFVDGNSLGMHINSGLDCRVRILFHRQWENPSAIELQFEQVTRINLRPSQENYADIIYDSAMVIDDGTIYWADDACWSLDQDETEKNKYTWISAKTLKWRDASDWMGPELRYGSPIIAED